MAKNSTAQKIFVTGKRPTSPLQVADTNEREKEKARSRECSVWIT